MSHVTSLFTPDQRSEIKKEHIANQIHQQLASLDSWRHASHFVCVSCLIVLLAFLCSGISNHAFEMAVSSVNQTDYGIVIDAGSHGSRLRLYSWPARIHDPVHPLSGPITFPKEEFAFSTSPGISSMADEGNNPDDTGHVCIKPLIHEVIKTLKKKKIDRNDWSTFPIFVKATAGMRDLDAISRAQIMNSIRQFLLNDTEVPFAFQWNWARVIAGEEEGVYGWLTVNNALKTTLLPAHETVGAMDMGGASMQITFSPVHTSVIEGYYGFVLGGQTIRLYSHSYLGYGWGNAIMRLTTRIGIETVLQALELNNFPVNSTAEFLTYLFGSQFDTTNITFDEHPSQQTPVLEDNPDDPANTTIPINPKIHNTQSIPEKLNPDTSASKAIKQMNLTATHPCYPKGHTFTFDLPSLVYPEGRFYIDVDIKQIILYMRSLGIPDQFIDKILSKKRLSPSAPDPRKSQKQFAAAASQLLEIPDVNISSLDNRRDVQIEGDDFILPWPVDDEGNMFETKSSSERTLLAAPQRLLKSKKFDQLLGKKNRHTYYSRKSLHGADSDVPFKPLDSPLPFNASPKVQWTINFVGSSNFNQCQKRARDLFYNEPCFIHSCAFNGVYQPRLEDSKFIAFGQFSKVQQALNLSAKATPSELERATKEICKKSKKEIRRERKLNNQYKPYGKNGVLNLCWKSIWSHTILDWGYGFSPDSNDIEFAQSVGDETFGWSTGSMIYEVNMFPWKTPIGQFEKPFLLATITTALFLLLTVLLMMQIRSHHRIFQLAGLKSGHVKVTTDDDMVEPRDIITPHYRQLD